MSGQGQQYGGGASNPNSSQNQADLNNHANQCNPNHSTYQGYKSGYQGEGSRADLNNHANQLNPNNSRFQPPKN